MIVVVVVVAVVVVVVKVRISETKKHYSALAIYCAKIRSSKVVRQIPETGAAEAVTSTVEGGSGQERARPREPAEQ